MVCYDFSSAYMLCDVEVASWPEEYAVASDALYSQIVESLYWSCEVAPRGVHVKVDSEMHTLETESSIPTDMIAVPEDAVDGDEENEVYVLKPRFVNYLRESGYLGGYD